MYYTSPSTSSASSTSSSSDDGDESAQMRKRKHHKLRHERHRSNGSRKSGDVVEVAVAAVPADADADYDLDEFESSSSSSSTLSSTSSEDTSSTSESETSIARAPAASQLPDVEGNEVPAAAPSPLEVQATPAEIASVEPNLEDGATPTSLSTESWAPLSAVASRLVAAQEADNRVPTVAAVSADQSQPHEHEGAGDESSEEVPLATLATSTRNSHNRVGVAAASPRQRQRSTFQEIVAESVKEIESPPPPLSKESSTSAAGAEAVQHPSEGDVNHDDNSDHDEARSDNILLPSPPDVGLESVTRAAHSSDTPDADGHHNQRSQFRRAEGYDSNQRACDDPDVEHAAPQREVIRNLDDDNNSALGEPRDAEPARNAVFVAPTYEYGAEDDDVLRALMIIDPTMRRLHFEAELISNKKCGDVDKELDALLAQVGCGGGTAATPRRDRKTTSSRLHSASSAHSGKSTKYSPGNRTLTSSAKSRRSNRSPPTTADGRPPFHVHEALHGLPHYDALEDEHCQEFLAENHAFQEHWKKMQEHLKPNHRVGARVRDALIPATISSSSRPTTAGSLTFDFLGDAADCASPTLSINSSRPGSSKVHTKLRKAIPAIRECLSDLDTGTSVDVANAITFFQKRREQLRKGLPQVVRNPNEALRIQLTGPTGTMRASKGEPWPPERQGKQQAPVPPRAPRPSIVLLRQPSMFQRKASQYLQREPSTNGLGRTASTLKILTSGLDCSANSSPTHASNNNNGGRSPRSPAASGRPMSSPKNSMRPPPSPSVARSGSVKRSRADGGSSVFLGRRPMSSSSRPLLRPPPQRAIPGEVPPTRFNSRSPYLHSHDEFTTFDALYFPDAHAMHQGTVAPNLYYLNRKEPAQSADQLMSNRASNPPSPHGDAKQPSLSILTETHINIIVRSEDYSRRQLKKAEQDRIVKLSAAFIAKTAFLTERQRQRKVISDAEIHKRKDILDEEAAAGVRLEQMRSKDRLQSLRNEEVFPVCPLYARGEGLELGFASSQSTVVDLRWSGGDSDSAALALLAFDQYDRFVITISAGESFRCPISGKPVIRSWGTFRFKATEDANRDGGKPRHSLENRTTVELLLHNLSPQCAIQRFVFVAMHPTKTGATLTPIRRAYLTIREPHITSGIPDNIAVPAAVLSPRATPTAKIDKLQTDTTTTEVASSRLNDHPAAACYTIGSVLRQWGLLLFEGDNNQLSQTAGSLSAQSSVDETPLRPLTTRTPSRGSRTLTSVSPSQRPLSMHVDDRLNLSGSPSPSQHDLSETRNGSGSKHRGGQMSRQTSAGARQQMPCTWKYICHDMCDPSVANVHRLPSVLESVLFINADDVWHSYTQTITKAVRASDEFYEKIFRHKMELHEALEREHLAMRKVTDRDLVAKLTAINPMKAAMLKSTAQHQPAPPKSTGAQLSESLRTPTGRRRSGWGSTLGAVKAAVALSSKPGSKSAR